MRSVSRTGPDGELHLLEGGVRGPAVWLVHGLDTTAASWLDVAPGLVDDHRVRAVDLPGFGRSPGTRRRSLRAHADLLVELVRRQDDEAVVLAGSSMGAVVAMLAAARHPRQVAGLVLFTPALPRRTAGRLDASFLPLLVAGAAPGMLALEPWRRSLLPAEQRVRTLVEAFAAEDSQRPSSATFDAMVADDQTPSRWGRIRAWSGAARSLFWWLARPDAYHEAGQAVRAPVTLVEGLRDPVLPRPVVRATLQRHPGWAQVSLAGVGHLPHLERPDAVADTIRAVTGVR